MDERLFFGTELARGRVESGPLDLKRDLLQPLQAVYERAFMQRLRHLDRRLPDESDGSPEAQVRYIQRLLASVTDMGRDPLAVLEPAMLFLDQVAGAERPDVEPPSELTTRRRTRLQFGFGAWCFHRAAGVALGLPGEWPAEVIAGVLVPLIDAIALVREAGKDILEVDDALCDELERQQEELTKRGIDVLRGAYAQAQPDVALVIWFWLRYFGPRGQDATQGLPPPIGDGVADMLRNGGITREHYDTTMARLLENYHTARWRAQGSRHPVRPEVTQEEEEDPQRRSRHERKPVYSDEEEDDTAVSSGEEKEPDGEPIIVDSLDRRATTQNSAAGKT